MRYVAISAVLMVVAACIATTASGQVGSAPRLVQPDSIRQSQYQAEQYVEARPAGEVLVAGVPEPAVTSGI